MSTTMDRKDVARELSARCADGVERAKRQGADEAEAYAVDSHSIEVGFEKGELKLTQTDDHAALGLRVFRNRSLGFSYTNQLEGSELDATAKAACTLATFAPPDDANRLPGPRPSSVAPPLLNEALAAWDIERVVDAGAGFVRLCQSDPRISIDSAKLSLTTSSAALASSTGIAVDESDAALSFNVFGMAIDGDDVGGFHYCGEVLRDPARLEERLAFRAQEFGETVLANLGARAGKAYRGPVLFSPAAFTTAFVSPLLSASSAIAVQRGRSALAGKLGEAVAIPGLTVLDDPTDLSLAGACAFDREGQPVSRFEIVRDGVLQSYLYNSYAANVEGRTSTGHASGSTRSVPGLSIHALVVPGGDGGSKADMLKRLGTGLFVERFSGTVDAASGDFSGVAKSARWVENGEVQHAVKETLLSGNAFSLLKGDVQLSAEQELMSGSARMPFALVDGVEVTAD